MLFSGHTAHAGGTKLPSEPASRQVAAAEMRACHRVGTAKRTPD